MSTTPFLKMHGLGNDFVVFDARSDPLALSAAEAGAIADRHRGVGCDQVIVMEPPHADGDPVFMRIYNADGSESGACGNATRCVGSLLMAETGAATTAVRTRAGILPMWAADGGHVRVDMGPVNTDWRAVPLAGEADTLHVAFDAGPFSDPVAVNVGNPHAVFFVEDAQAAPLADFGYAIEHDPLFPDRINVQAAQVVARDHVIVRTWERGVGLTSASGSSACAVLAAAVRRGMMDRRGRVELAGGTLTVDWAADNHVYQEGPVSHSFQGELDIAALAAEARP